MTKRGPFGLPSTFASIKKFGLVRDSNPHPLLPKHQAIRVNLYIKWQLDNTELLRS